MGLHAWYPVCTPWGCTLGVPRLQKGANFILGSFIGDIPIVLLYSLAGGRLATLNSASEAISPLAIVILAATGILLIVGALGERKEKTRS